jgi:hypothetical protein
VEVIFDGGRGEEVPKLSPHALDGLSNDEGASITRREDRVNVVCLVCNRRSNGVGVLLTFY